MTRKIDLPPEEHVRAVMAGMLADTAAGGPRPTVLALARNLGLTNAALRRERDYLASQLEAALSHLRRLTIDNAELRRELETARAITRIGRLDAAGHG
ncbi:MAG TPA: hypothetical protein VMV92_23495 [Streptosporangiaceae bacterium]|nr:hypothetical protein [Streptosporangiaceae bacterium]